MELIKKNIHMEQRLNLAATQISLEEDQNISDQKPDAFRIVCKKTDVKIEETKVQDDSVLLKGMLIYRILYLTDEDERRLCNMEGEIPFEEKIYTTQTGINDEMRVVTHVEDMMVRLINSRKMNIRCIIATEIQCDTLYDEEVIVDVEQPDRCEVLKKNLDITTVVLDTKDIYRIKEEISVPEGYSNIYSMIWKNVRVDGMSFTPMDGRIGIQGEWTAFFMYEGEEEETVPRYFEVTRPIGGMLDVPECQENMTLYVDWEMEQPQIEIRTDYDGEERLIGMDAELKLYIKLYRNEELLVVADAYGLQEKLEPITKESACRQIIKKETGKIKINDIWENKEYPDESIQILHVDGCIVDEKTVVGENEIKMMGVVHMEALCKTEEDGVPYRCITMDMPYIQEIAVSGMQKDGPYSASVEIEQLHAGAQGGRIDMRAMLCYRLIAYRKASQPLLAGLEKALENGQDKTLPTMSVYFAKENELIWDIGKKYQVSLNDIREANQIKSDVLCGGEKILIAKEMK